MSVGSCHAPARYCLQSLFFDFKPSFEVITLIFRLAVPYSGPLCTLISSVYHRYSSLYCYEQYLGLYCACFVSLMSCIHTLTGPRNVIKFFLSNHPLNAGGHRSRNRSFDPCTTDISSGSRVRLNCAIVKLWSRVYEFEALRCSYKFTFSSFVFSRGRGEVWSFSCWLFSLSFFFFRSDGVPSNYCPPSNSYPPCNFLTCLLIRTPNQ